MIFIFFSFNTCSLEATSVYFNFLNLITFCFLVNEPHLFGFNVIYLLETVLILLSMRKIES